MKNQSEQFSLFIRNVSLPKPLAKIKNGYLKILSFEWDLS